MKIYRQIFLLGVLSLGGFQAMALGAQEGQAPTSRSHPRLGRLLPAEAEVLKKISAGQKVSFEKERLAKAEGVRRLRPAFLAQLLTNGFPGVSIHYHGVEIAQGLIEDPADTNDGLDLVSAEIQHEVRLTDCDFTGPLVLQDSNFKKNLCFKGSRFKEKVNLSGLEVKKSLSLEGATFHRELDLRRTHVGGSLILKEAKLSLEGGKVQCDAVQVDSDCDLEGTEFPAGISLSGANIKGDLLAYGCAFCEKAPDQYASFFGLSIGQNAFFHATKAKRAAKFFGNVDFHGANIGKEFRIDEVHFLGNGKEVDLGGLKVGTLLSLEDACFNRSVNLVEADIRGSLLATKARFMDHREDGKGGYTNLSGLKVGNRAQFSSTEFAGDVDLSGATVGKTLIGKPDGKIPEEKGVKFKGGKIEGSLILDDALLATLTVEGTSEQPLVIKRLTMERARIRQGLTLNHVNLEALRAWNLQCRGPAIISNIKFLEPSAQKDTQEGLYPAEKWRLDLREANFQSLKISEVIDRPLREEINLEGMEYQTISAVGPESSPGGEKDREKLIAWLEGSRFNKGNYTQLERFFLNKGQKDAADRVFIAMNDREWTIERIVAERTDFFLYLIRYPFTWIWKHLTGYGREPWRALLFAMVWLSVGAFVFSSQYLKDDFLKGCQWCQLSGDVPSSTVSSQEIQPTEGAVSAPPSPEVPAASEVSRPENPSSMLSRSQELYVRILLSLDQLLPSQIDMGLAKHLDLPKFPFWRLVYYQFHTMMGWVCIVLIGLAAITAKLK